MQNNIYVSNVSSVIESIKKSERTSHGIVLYKGISRINIILLSYNEDEVEAKFLVIQEMSEWTNVHAKKHNTLSKQNITKKKKSNTYMYMFTLKEANKCFD